MSTIRKRVPLPLAATLLAVAAVATLNDAHRTDDCCTDFAGVHARIAQVEHPRELGHPRLSGSVHGSNPRMGPLWRVLFRHGVDVALNGHDHLYERFALMNPRGELAPSAGIRQYTVGTGGRGLYAAVRRSEGRSG